MTDVKREARLTLTEGDVNDILTEALCRYGPFADLRVAAVTQDESCAFHLTLMPVPEEAPNGNEA